ncbi:pilus assembly FimT family protein [Acinetobacter wuhouensis]|uniref:Type II secretion system protein H n=1 Tax=Acinetobacter wuhouensis TaxID=1879050 RepID=A0A3G2T6B0_9GAMM|nr:GspH/FimT family pseudopilin [Acinetobacter wuhouensis]AYO55809.1 prepilin-type N-terminal cleavage/methylation domain-containing protein [Acinetobacter wuhouensis]
MRFVRGFTLIELLVTIAVLAIVTMLAAPSFGNMITQQNLKKSTNELIGVLNQARAKAALERRNIEVELNLTEIDSLSENTDTTMYWMPYGKTHLTPTSETEITYGLNGGVVGAGGDTTFTLCSVAGGKSQTVSVSKMGTIQQIVDGVC